ncbi:MAG: HAD-IB family phosphatase [Candidatus Moranbacteria bacterium]|nr:HAD-IB family phosphatase [Candidatus Moranbacteria bacterium]
MNKLIIDFDSTLVEIETLDRLAEEALKGNRQKARIISEIKRLTSLGMDGTLPFSESLNRRIGLIETDRKTVEKVAKTVARAVSGSVLDNLDFFQKNQDDIFVISGGFEELIFPVTDLLGIKRKNVLANRFVFDHAGGLVGADKDNLMAGDCGKIKQVRALGLEGNVIMVGDGWTDYQVRESGAADIFIAYTENVRRENVVQKADLVTGDFAEVIRYFNNP